MELVRYAKFHKQQPIIKEEFVFIVEYPKIAKKILTMISPDISIERPHYKIARKRKNIINYVKQVKVYIKK
ncbi:MAG: hypothetical protein ACFFCI_13040 [Promethearchaeota archaeon]